MAEPQTQRYTPLAQLLHWLVFLLFVTQYSLATTIDVVGRGSFEDFLYATHKSIGLTLLLLVFVRIWWRRNHPPPPDNLPYPQWQKRAATATHHLLYVAMVVMPVSGYVFVMAGGYGATLFGLPVPDLIGKWEALGDLAEEVHAITGWIIGALLCMHIGAALYHQVMLKDNLISRMLPIDIGQARGQSNPGHESGD